MTQPVKILEPGAGLFAAFVFDLDRLARSMTSLPLFAALAFELDRLARSMATSERLRRHCSLVGRERALVSVMVVVVAPRKRGRRSRVKAALCVGDGGGCRSSLLATAFDVESSCS
jgi:hypothetical protein